MLYAIVFTVGYFVGGFPTGVVLSRQKYGIDVREMGSGNIGATNVTRTFGWKAGLITFLIDAVKGWLPLRLLLIAYPDDEWLAAIMASALVIGHCFSPYLKFRGGKGVATGLGAILVVAPELAVVSGIVYLLGIAITRISAVGSLGGTAIVLLYCAIWEPDRPLLFMLLGVSAIILVRHRSNMLRLWESRMVKPEAK